MEKITSQAVIEHVKKLLNESALEITEAEKKEQQKYAVLIQSRNDKQLLTRMLDESSQIRNNRKLSRRIKHLLKIYGIPGFFNSFDTMLIRAFASFGYLFDFVAIPIFKRKLRQDTSAVIINEKPSVFFSHLRKRQQERIGQNVNLLGEVVLGDSEAETRYKHYLEGLQNPQINYISIKISGIYAQINALNYEQNKLDLVEKISNIYRKAMEFSYTNEQGNQSPKFVNLDMEEYKDSHLTLDVFFEVLSNTEFKHYPAGIVLQAYLPDAWSFQTRLLEFAHRRLATGGAPIKMRLVKGANLAMETVVSSLKGWPNPIYDTKIDVDANYMKILDRALEPANAACVHVGVASHNLFTLSYSYLLALKNGVLANLSFEMLEGMANYLPRVMKSLNKQIILYTPVVSDENFLNAVSYLVRRLDENTGRDNFLSYSFNLTYGSETWHFLQSQFEEALSRKENVNIKPYRTQDRNEKVEFRGVTTEFSNEPDTNFDLPQNRIWAMQIHNRWKKDIHYVPNIIPVQIGEKEVYSKKTLRYYDHSQNNEVCVAEACLATTLDVELMIMTSEKDESGWAKKTLDERTELLHRVAINIVNKRGELIGCMSAVTGKTFFEGDVEVSEAVDFCRYYPLSLRSFYDLQNIKLQPCGLILVIPPWNFPTAIPVGGVAAALAGGNRVILKPATVAYPIARMFVECFWDAGIPKDALQLVCTDGREPLKYLTTHPAVKQVIFTGGTDTALKLMQQNPACPVSAETGGKNAIILTSACDRDHAILNVLTSAFSNAGQKCSACSLLLLEKEIFDDESFREKLKDAVLSLHAGQVWDHGNIVGPMVTNNNDKLEKALELEPGETWLVPPVITDELKYILKPAVKWGVKPGSYTFVTELFAPLLAVVRIENLEDGINMVNSTGYGLTSGLQSLDEEEHEIWKQKIEAGNLYINRGITGAIVGRQPFGGMKLSAFGPGIKAGGPNYAVSFIHVKEQNYHKAEVQELWIKELQSKQLISSSDAVRLQIFIQSCQHWWKHEFSVEKDIHQILGEKNIFRYLALKKMALRIYQGDSFCDLMMVLKAAELAGTQIDLSSEGEYEIISRLKTMSGWCSFHKETDAEFAERMHAYERIRCVTSDIPRELIEQSSRTGLYIASKKPVIEGRIEMLHYMKEQSVSYEYHRYGNIIED